MAYQKSIHFKGPPLHTPAGKSFAYKPELL